MGCVVQAGIGQAPARQAALKAGLPPEVSALTVNMVCGSGLRAVALASQSIKLGDADFVVAGEWNRCPIFLTRFRRLGMDSAWGIKP
jgi:acetyl-CoA C-acetyltransferase